MQYSKKVPQKFDCIVTWWFENDDLATNIDAVESVHSESEFSIERDGQSSPGDSGDEIRAVSYYSLKFFLNHL